MKILNSLVKGASKALDKTPSWLSNFGVSKYLYKNLALTAFALGAPLYVGAQGTQNALDRIDTKNHIEASAEGYEGTKEKDSIIDLLTRSDQAMYSSKNNIKVFM